MFNDSEDTFATKSQSRGQRNHKGNNEPYEIRSLKKANRSHQPRQKRFTDVIDEDDEDFYEG